MHVAATGASGLVGSALARYLTHKGHRFSRFVRRPPEGDDEIPWDSRTGLADPDRLASVDAVVHLAGESIATRWTARRKAEIRRSRVDGTRTLSRDLAALPDPPRTLVCASAIGFYGDRGDETLDEESDPGEGFLAEVCREWEKATAEAADAGIRVINTRFGMILSSEGGALAKMLTPFRLGLGGRLGSGEQYMSWVAIDDVVRIVEHALADEELAGPVNAVAPRPVTNREFTETLASVLSRPAIFPMPASAARLAFGAMADELLLASQRVVPARLRARGFAFELPELERALTHLVGRRPVDG